MEFIVGCGIVGGDRVGQGADQASPNLGKIPSFHFEQVAKETGVFVFIPGARLYCFAPVAEVLKFRKAFSLKFFVTNGKGFINN